MIKIRLARGGVKNDPYYRIVAIDHKRKNAGKPLAVIGHWYPKKEDFSINKKELDKWVGRGAQLSATVRKLVYDK